MTDLPKNPGYSFNRTTGPVAASAGVLGIVGMATSLLPGSLTSSTDTASVRIAALITQSTIIVIAIIAATVVLGMALRNGSLPLVRTGARLESYRQSLSLAIRQLMNSSGDPSGYERAMNDLRKLEPPEGLEKQHEDAILALGQDPESATLPTEQLIDLLASVSSR